MGLFAKGQRTIQPSCPCVGAFTVSVLFSILCYCDFCVHDFSLCYCALLVAQILLPLCTLFGSLLLSDFSYTIRWIISLWYTVPFGALFISGLCAYYSVHHWVGSPLQSNYSNYCCFISCTYFCALLGRLPINI